MRLYLNILGSLLIALFGLNAMAQYTSLPDSRIIQLDDYDNTAKWTHTGEPAPGRAGQVLLDGTFHEHVSGWNVIEARTGYAGGYGTIIPPYVTSNYAANLRNVAGARIESPYYPDGLGTLYFEAVNSENPYPATPLYLHVYVATNMSVAGGGTAPMQSAETATLTYIWVPVDAIPLNYSSASDFKRYERKFNYNGAARFKLVREDATPGFSGADDQFLVVDNIRVSYPASSVVMDELASSVTSNPDFSSGTLNVRCQVNQFNNQGSVNNPTVTIVYRTALPGGPFGNWANAPLGYVSGTGDGNGMGLEYTGAVTVGAEGEIEYYYTSDFEGYYISPDYTGLGYVYPTESLAPVALYEDGMGGADPFDKSWAFGVIPPVTDLPDNRILIFDDYLASKWTHTGEPAPGRAGQVLLDGTFHTQTNGWKISEARTGYAGGYGLVVPQKGASNYACNMRNQAGSSIESPLYEDGVGTIYFETVNSENPYPTVPIDLHVYITTNMFDWAWYTNVALGTEEGGTISNVWHELDVLHLNYTTQDEFTRYFSLLNYRGRIKVKLVREQGTPGLTEPDDQFLVVDNVRISPPPTDVTIIKTEVVSNPGYPNANNDFTVRCYASNTDTNVPTENRSLLLVYRWRYLTQQVNDWQTNEMSLVDGTGDGNGNDEIYECTVDASDQIGDIEYYYLSYFGGYVYESPDYTATGFEYPYPSENLSPQVLRGVPEIKEFSLRLRDYNSVYGNLYVVSDQHAQPIQMNLVDDHQWRGLVPVTGLTPTNLSWNLMAESEYFDGAESYSTNRTYWAAAASLNGSVPNLPYGGVFVETNESARITVEVEDSGYMMVSFNTETLVFLITRAEYQNFNAWPAREDFFSESSGQSDKQSFENDFDEWPLSEDQVFIEPFAAFVSTTNVYQRDPFITPLDWVAGSAAYVSERTLDTEYGPAGINNYRNLALRLKGGDTALGLGYVYNTLTTLPDGLKQINFKARIGQSSDNTQISYNRDFFTLPSYTVTANKVGSGNMSPENPSVSIVGYYQDYQNFYEFRVVQVANPSDVIGNVNDQRVDFYLIKWLNGVAYQLDYKKSSSNLTISRDSIVQMRFYTSGNSTRIKCRYANLDNIIDKTDSTNPFMMGTFGVISSECLSHFAQITYQTSDSNANATGTPVYVLGAADNAPGGPAGAIPGQKAHWFVPTGVYEFRTDVTPPGIYRVITNQKLDVYVQETDYGSNQEPSAPGTLAWVLLREVTIPDFEYQSITVDIEWWQSHFVMLQVGDGNSDVAVDELEVRSWHGRKIGDGDQNDYDWLATEAWIVSNGVDDAANQVMQLNHSRADPEVDQAVRSLLLENGMGLMEFDFRVLNPPARVTVQYANQGNEGSWFEVASLEVSNVTAWAHATAYLGSFDPGYLRVLNERTGIFTNALIELNNVVVWDEPYVDDKSWRSYNSKITSADPMRLLLDESKGCFLNNSQVDETNPSPQDRDVPNLQSPLLVKGLGTLSFQARAYDDGEPATIYVYASTNGWMLPREYWVLVDTFENIDHEYYKPYSYSPVEGAYYDSIRMETTIGAKRVCIEEVVVSEPVYPGFDIVNVRLLKYPDGTPGVQPLAFEDVHVEAMVANQQLSPSNIVLYVSYYVGDDLWGVENWWSSPDKVTRRMLPVLGDSDTYRTVDSNYDGPDISPNYVGGILGQEENAVVQYRVWATYLGGIPLNEYQEVFDNPEWYFPVDLNAENSAEGWSPYYFVYGVQLGAVYVNEINVGDVRYDNNYNILHGIWEHAYVEIAMPAWMDLGGWLIDVVSQNSYETQTIPIPTGLPSQTPVTNGYAFFIITDAIAPPSSATPALPKVDFAYAGFAGIMPKIRPGGFRLRRPGGMYEQTIAFDDATWNGAGSSYNGQYWADSDPDGLFKYVGEEQNQGSLSKIGLTDTTNNWVYPLILDPDIVANRWTPGLPNGLQELLNGDELLPGISNALINSSLTQLRGTQNGRRVTDYSLRLPMGASSNIVYQVDDWYRMVSLTANSVEVLPPDSAFTSYTHDVNDIEGDVNLVAKINIREDLTEYQNDSEVINWVLGFEEGPLVPMFYNDQVLDLTEQYWLDANPTISNEFNCVIRDFYFDGQTNLHVRLEMKLNQNNMTNIQGGAVLKLQSKEDLLDSTWDMLAQYYLTPASFGSNNQCLVFVTNPFQFILSDYDMKSLFLRWVIEFDDPRIIIQELENQDTD